MRILLIIIILMVGCDPSGDRRCMCNDALKSCKKILEVPGVAKNAYQECLNTAFENVCNCSDTGRKEIKDEIVEEGN